MTDKVFMDLTVGGKPAGRIVLGMFGKACPRTCANFVALGGSLGTTSLHSNFAAVSVSRHYFSALQLRGPKSLGTTSLRS